MQVIYKYSLPYYQSTVWLQLPQEHRFLHIGLQGGNPQAWIQQRSDGVDTRTVMVEARYTGQAYIPKESEEYLGSLELPDGLVLHYFAQY